MRYTCNLNNEIQLKLDISDVSCGINKSEILSKYLILTKLIVHIKQETKQFYTDLDNKN